MSLRIVILLAMAGCAADLAPDTDGVGDTDEDSDVADTDDDPNQVPWLTLTTEGADTVAVVDATDAAAWRHLDLWGKAGVTPADPATDAAWHLAANRFNLKVNGGVSGSLGVDVVFLAGVALGDAAPPADGWGTDRADENGDGKPELAIQWFDYNPQTHVLTPKVGTWILRAPAGWVALQVEDYYDDAGNSGFMRLRWR
jgi:hypothetical protein